MHFGAFSKARSEFETILRLYDPRQHRSQPVHYVHDPKVSALTYLALVLWVLGFPDPASCECCSVPRRRGVASSKPHGTRPQFRWRQDELLGDVRGVRAHADAIVDLADRHSLGYWRLNGLILRGWAMVQQGATVTGLVLMCQNAAERTAQGVTWYQARFSACSLQP